LVIRGNYQLLITNYFFKEEGMKDKKAAYQQGVNIFILLAVLTIIEFFLGIWSGSLAWLMLVALAKAGLVVYYYMHIYRVWREENH
jgi:hypothetical protein